MFKRMSVLVRRDQADRADFSRKWEAHAAPVSQLPGIRGYIQNHVTETFAAEGALPLRADGFVELLWDTPEAMAAAFASPAARPMVEDEPGFLGHGSGYALATAEPLREALGGKLIVASVRAGDRPALDRLAGGWRALEGLERLIRDEVTGLIPKPGMSPPQPADAFLHLYFGDEATARRAGAAITRAAPPGVGVWRVRTIRFV